MGAFFTGLWAFIKSAPALWALYKELSHYFKLARKEIDSKKRIKRLKDGLEFARKTKNTSQLEGIFREN